MPTMMQETFKPLNGQMQNHFTLDVSIPWRTSPSALHLQPAELRKVSGTVGPLCHKATWNHGPGRGMIHGKNHHPVLPVLWENCWNMLKFHYHGHPKMDVQYSIPVPWRADFLVCQLSLFIVFRTTSACSHSCWHLVYQSNYPEKMLCSSSLMARGRYEWLATI